MSIDEEEFIRYFEETSSMVYNLGYRLFNDRDRALDFSQDVYLQAFENRHKFKGRSKFSTWLYSLAMNSGLNRLKKERRLQFSELSGDEPSGSDPVALAHEEMETRKLEHIIQHELQNLPDEYRLPLILYYYEKKSYREIALLLDLKENTLKSLLRRGRMRIRDALRPVLKERDL